MRDTAKSQEMVYVLQEQPILVHEVVQTLQEQRILILEVIQTLLEQPEMIPEVVQTNQEQPTVNNDAFENASNASTEMYNLPNNRLINIINTQDNQATSHTKRKKIFGRLYIIQKQNHLLGKRYERKILHFTKNAEL